MTLSRRVDYAAWGRYYFGRALELLGLVVVGNGLLVSLGSPTLWPLLYLSVAGIALFLAGWLLARKNPAA